MVTKDNFYIATKVTWKRLKHGDHAYNLFDQLKGMSGIAVVKPQGSSSAYLINESAGEVYRLSDHWGVVASCWWGLDRPLEAWQLLRHMPVIAVAKFADFIIK